MKPNHVKIVAADVASVIIAVVVMAAMVDADLSLAGKSAFHDWVSVMSYSSRRSSRRSNQLEAVMDEKPIFKVGDRIDQMCVTCNEERGHVVVSVSKTGSITRVSCPMCGSRVAYRAGTTRHAHSKVVAPYDRARTYRKGQILMHPMFGEGEVTAIIEPQKMDVLFADRMRRLIHEHS